LQNRLPEDWNLHPKLDSCVHDNRQC
jgi:hypothetical protein